MNEEVELVPMEDGKFYMKLEDVNKSIEVATFKLQQENQSLKDRIEKAIELIKKQLLSNSNYTGYTDEMCLKDLSDLLKGDK